MGTLAEAMTRSGPNGVIARMNKQAASILAKTQMTSGIFEGLAATPQASRLVTQMNEQAASILAKTQMTSRVFEGLAATPEWARIITRINEAAAETLVELGTRPESAVRDPLVADPELEQVVELATTVAADATRPEPSVSVPPLVITATIFIAVYALLLTLYFDAFEGTSDYLLSGNIVERLDMMNSLAELAGGIAFACTPRRKR
ncbi:MAG TPA: hypothetical protein VG497_28960 [Kribbella sp.]|nr:hypothetical protein [Kribbella sp.]